MTGQTRAFRRLGTDDVRQFTAVINPPQAAKLGQKVQEPIGEYHWVDRKNGKRLGMRADGKYRDLAGDVWVPA